jgi:hypothetical protein
MIAFIRGMRTPVRMTGEHLPKQYADGTLRVYHVPGNGM